MTRKLGTAVLGLVLIVGLAAAGLGATGITQSERTTAILDGLTWLVGKQQADGSFISDVSNPTERAYPVAQTALALYKLESYALHTGVSPFDSTWSLSSHVVDGWKFLMTRKQTAGNFESAAFGSSPLRGTYETALVMLALQASGAPNMPVPANPSQALTFFEVLKGCVSWLSTNQETTGGWKYRPFAPQAADMSICRWAVEGLMAAEAWGIAPPNYVKSRLMVFLTALQDQISGGFGYYQSSDVTPPAPIADQTGYFATTAAGLIGLSYCGVDSSDPRWTSAAGYICKKWSESFALNCDDYFNIGNIYAMYALATAALVANPQEVWDFCGHEWQPEYDRWLVDNQTNGFWAARGALPWAAEGQSKVLATEYALLILEKDAPIPYDPLTSFEDLLRRQANALLSFETLLKTNWSALGWTERMLFLRSFEFVLREQAERIESFENLLHAASDRLTDLQRTNFAKSFEDLLKRQAKLLASFEELLEKVSEPGLPHIDWDHVFEQEPQAK